MPQFQSSSLIITTIFLLYLHLPSLTSSSSSPYKALVSPLYKDPTTSLYTIPIENGNLLVLDLANPLIWSVCPADHPAIPCSASTCADANQFPPKCTYKQHQDCATSSCNCTATPFNPVSGQCGSGDLTLDKLTTNATDGKNPLYPLSVVNAVKSCAPRYLLTKLPATATGIGGFGSSDLTLPSQLSSLLSIYKQFALCLPAGGTGVSFFGSGPFYLLGIIQPNISALLSYTPLIKNPSNPAYYISIKGIAVNQLAVPVRQNAFTDGVMLSTVSPYTVLREDIYQPFLKAYVDATKGYPRVAPVKPFELCFDSSKLGSTRVGYAVPQIDLIIEGSMNWTVFGANSMAQVGPSTVCLAFLPNQTAQTEAVVIGGFQMENNFLQFDLSSSRLGFSGLLFGIMTTCNNFNFTYAN